MNFFLNFEKGKILLLDLDSISILCLKNDLQVLTTISITMYHKGTRFQVRYVDSVLFYSTHNEEAHAHLIFGPLVEIF